jgi:hypothetical protein
MRRAAQAKLGALLTLIVSLTVLPACSSDDKRPLVLFDVPLGELAPVTTAVAASVAVAGNQVATMREAPNPQGHYGIWLPNGTSGAVTIAVEVVGAGECVLARGTAPSSASPGETTAAVTVPLTASGETCAVDAGAPDSALPLDAGGADLPLGPEAGAGPEAGLDAGVDAAPGERPAIDTAVDQPTDAPAGTDAADAPLAVDLSPDGGEAGPTTMNIENCTAYDHSANWNGSYGVRQVLFSPDGKYLISVGNDARLKVWNVTPTGISPLATNLVFPGGSKANPVAAFSSDGTLLAVGEGFDIAVTVYDFAASLKATSGAVTAFTIARPMALTGANSVDLVQFTADGHYLVTFYKGDSLRSPKQSYLVLWQLAATPTNMKQVNYPLEETVYGVATGNYGAPVTVASAAVARVDAGQQTTLTVTDIMAVPAVKAQGALLGTVDRMALAPDGSVIVGLSDSGEVSRWTVAGTSLMQDGRPLVAGSTAGNVVNTDFALTVNGKYLAAAMSDWSSTLVHLVPLSRTEPLKSLTPKYDPLAVAFAPNGLALAIGESGKSTLLYCTP